MMSSSRFGRLTKGRTVIYVLLFVLVVALIAFYKNIINLLDETHQNFITCRQEQENISQQLHVVFDYKQKLEKTLQAEKAEKLQTKTDYKNKLNAETQKCEKIQNEAKLRFSTLQQHYNLLQTQHDDIKDECSKIQSEQLHSINQLQAKLAEVQEELKRFKSDKENQLHHAMAQKDALEFENNHLKEKLSNNKPDTARRTEYSSTQFNKVIPVGNAQYLIPMVNADAKQKHAEEEAVLAMPSNGNAPHAVYTPKTSSAANALNVVLPLNAPSATPSSASRKTPVNPMPVPMGVVAAPELDIDIDANNSRDKPKAVDPMDERYKNVADRPAEGEKDKRDELKSQFNAPPADLDNGANEEYDMPNNPGHPRLPPVGNKAELHEDKEQVHKKHEAIAAVAAGDNDYEDAGNNLDEGEEGDDPADGNPLAGQEEAERH